MTTPVTAQAPAPADLRRVTLRWLVTFLGFPVGGAVAEVIAGRVTDAPSAILGGLITGAVLGAGQWWGLRPARVGRLAFVGATAIGLAVGLSIGAATVGYDFGLGDLAQQGAISGLAVGSAQAVVLARLVGRLALVWPPILAAVWALGWTVTTSIGVDVDAHYTVFGSSGAVVATLLTTALPLTLARSKRGTT